MKTYSFKFKKLILGSKLNIDNCKNRIDNISTRRFCTENYSFSETNIDVCENENIKKCTNSTGIIKYLLGSIKNVSSGKMVFVPFLAVMFIAALIMCFGVEDVFTDESFVLSKIANQKFPLAKSKLFFVAPKNNTSSISTPNDLDSTKTVSSLNVSNFKTKAPSSKNITTSYNNTTASNVTNNGVPVKKYKNNLSIYNKNLAKKTITISTNNFIKIKRPELKFLPSYFSYTNINQAKLRNYLNRRNSKLAEEPYFSQIIAVSKKYNLNPLVLFAITGQEQSFVPKNSKYASRIANNPYNIYCSWKNYNTTITDSSEIVAKTIINLSKGRPSNVDPFEWINRRYASDPNWSKGVRDIFYELIRITK
ncbi:hypothetical protein CLTEP_23530 [Clostridium tepidiprofundi DSM 19306]|uniref:Mannosyl-glycoprotein endo-beta-N-acetylglucosamidase-like domain-containing protein n=1 Tax=Clostridium tepidiprofundi DSM 19306 TaxID=1121338 RepID=A0A151AVJ8_9CLOT|nr:glucosaminidase domain-containing protein [Clostridium tepidiprofundi]KYH31570.1 hypothetical protein CLTEP_23530 [Clostridium tepidiprofundi DSM 19306]